MTIEILATGCAKCNVLDAAVREVADGPGIDYELEHVTDLNRIAGYGVMMTPALVIDGQVKTAGAVPVHRELERLLGGKEESR